MCRRGGDISPHIIRCMDVRRMRLRAGLSQRQLADLSGIAQPNISAYESGRLTPSPATLARIAKATAVRPSALLAQMREDIMAVAARHHASDVHVFGSVATGSDTPSSDLDLLVTSPMRRACMTRSDSPRS